MLPLRFALLAAASLVASAAVAAACADDRADGPSTTDAGGAPDPVGVGICPDAPPEAGKGCVLPEGTTCAFGACGTPIAECRGGLWRYGGNPPPRPACPGPEAPASESTCPPCWPAAITCDYGSCSGPDASPNTAVASCPNGAWALQFSPCPLVSDAGADVQGDAGSDAD